ncbi:hypothetical protein QUS22_04260 [Wolbachia pipientis]|nr:hypothetical protein [Wolbachia pipientis]
MEFIFCIKNYYFSGTNSRINFEPFFKTGSSGPDYITSLPELTDFDRGV